MFLHYKCNIPRNPLLQYSSLLIKEFVFHFKFEYLFVNVLQSTYYTPASFDISHLCFLIPVSRHRTLMNLFNKTPTVDKDAFVAPSASLIGDVHVGRNASIWYGCVLRGMFCFP